MSRAVKMKTTLFDSIYVSAAVIVNEFCRNNLCAAIRILKEGRRFLINSVYEIFVPTTEIRMNE